MLEFLIGFTAVGGVSSQTLMDIALIFIFFVFVRESIKDRAVFNKLTYVGIEWAFVGFFIAAVLSLAINGKDPVPWWFYLSRFSWIINFYLLIYAFRKIKVNYDRWLFFFAVAFMIPSLYALVTLFVQYDYLTQTPIHRVVGMVNSATYHAHGNGLIFIFFASIFLLGFNTVTKKTKILATVGLIIMGLSILLTFTRGIWFATFFSLLVLTLIKGRKFFLTYISVTIIAVSLTLTLSPTMYSRLTTSFTTTSDQLRSQLIQVHWAMFKEHPVIGIGYWDSYRQIEDYWPKVGLPSDHYVSHSHNQFLNILATTGLIGFIFFVAMILFFIKRSLKFIRDTRSAPHLSPLAYACGLVLLQFLLSCLTDVTFEYAKIKTLVIIVFAIIIVYGKIAITAGQNDPKINL